MPDQFNGHLEEGCRESSIPTTLSLLSFVSCVMHGSSATSCENEYYKQAMLTVSQLSSSSYHSSQREPPLPVYIGLMIHNKTRDLALIEKLSKLGLCISKHRVSQL